MVSRRGGNRGTTFSDLTTKRFTGQYHEQALPGGEGLAYYNARWYDPQLGRFVSPDSIVPSPSNPQSLNRFSYVRNNPLNRIDPTGHAECVDVECNMRTNPTNGNVIIANTGGSVLYELILRAQIGNDTAPRRLKRLLDETSSVKGRIRNVARLNFGGFAKKRGDKGFRRELADGYYYENFWGGKTQQTGHFLTAVNMGYNPGILEWLYNDSMVGHEIMSDEPSINYPKGIRNLRQVTVATDNDIESFQRAISFDEAGFHFLRDAELNMILDTIVHGGVQNRVGNSMEDLRLTVRGVRLGRLVYRGELQTNKHLANWIAWNIAE